MDLSVFKFNLRALMESRGLTNSTFSDEIGIPAPTISRYLSGDRTPDFEYVVKIAKHFNVSVDWLAGLNDDKFSAMPQELRDIATYYSIATEDDRNVVQAVLQKYKIYKR